jgi:parallel beta-helix repeat protein
MNTGRKNIKLVLVVGMGIMFLFAVLGSTSFAVKSSDIPIDEPHSAGSWTLASIFIDGSNWATIESTEDWCTGSGTEGDPYLIENVTVNRLTSGSAIRIQNSRGIYFKIQNCTTNWVGDYAGYGGIHIVNSDFGELIGNNCSGGGGTGIFFDDCDNMTVRDNILSGNGYHGIIFDGSSSGSCDENVISGNTMVNNSVLGIYLNHNNSHNIISGNLIDGLGSQVNGMAFSNFGDSNTISGNTIQNILSISINFGYMSYNDSHNFNYIIGNTIIGSSRGVYFETDGVGNAIINNNFIDQTLYGLWVEGDNPNPELGLQSTLVQDNAFLNCKSGIVIGRYTEDSLILGNLINGSATLGINLYSLSENNIVQENTITYNKVGIWLQYSDKAHPIINNTINYNTEYGIYGLDCEAQTILDNVIQYNNLSGIYLWYSDKNIITGNIISNSIQDGLILLESGENVISGNDISKNQNGILVNESNDNRIVGNMINDNELSGILLDSSNYTVIHDNLLGGNLVCIEKVDSEGTIEYDNLCIAVDDEALDFSSVLDALTETEGIIIGGTGLGIGAIISALASAGRKKKKK